MLLWQQNFWMTTNQKRLLQSDFKLIQRVHNRGSQIPLSRLFFFSIPPSRPILRPNLDPVPFFTRFFA